MVKKEYNTSNSFAFLVKGGAKTSVVFFYDYECNAGRVLRNSRRKNEVI